MKVLVCVTTATMALAGSAAGATPTELNAYLGTARQKLATHDKLAATVPRMFGLAIANETEATLPAKLQPVLKKLRANANALSGLETAPDLKALNGALTKSFRVEINGIESMGKSFASGAANAGLNKYEAAAVRATELQRHWRDELIVKLRRVGVSAPLWLKNVGK